MFTGIVTGIGTVRRLVPLGEGHDMRIEIAAPETAPWADTASIAPSAPAGSKMYFIDAASATAWPPVSRCTPFGTPVVPLV